MNQNIVKTHVSLFSGQGGFDLAAQRTGYRNLAHCEWNPFAAHILKYYWPKAQSHSDIHQVDFTVYKNRVFLLTGGFPCQPYSNAGKMKGKEDERHLWPQMLRAIDESKPAWIIGENVKGLVNWNDGEVFEDIITDLKKLGFETQPYIIPAAAVGAPHLRERIWFVAFNAENRKNLIPDFTPIGKDENIYDHTLIEQNFWDNFPAYHPVISKESDIALLLKQHGIEWANSRGKKKRMSLTKWKTEAIKAGGNAIVHQVALEIMKSIEIYESLYVNESVTV